MRALTLALLAAAADAAKWPLGAPHADSVPATHARLATARGDVRRRGACARVRHYLPAPSQSFSQARTDRGL